MSYYLGIDLGSTTTKAVLIDQNEEVIGRGLTNTRCNYFVATEIAKSEALNSARFFLVRKALKDDLKEDDPTEGLVAELGAHFRVELQYRQLEVLKQVCDKIAPENIRTGVKRVFECLDTRRGTLFEDVRTDQSRFFRDMAGSAYYSAASEVSNEFGLQFDALVAVYDKAILQVENHVLDVEFGEVANEAAFALFEKSGANAHQHVHGLPPKTVSKALKQAIDFASRHDLAIAETVGTGYGRQRLPFEKRQIRSEILCHGLGAHFMFPNTRTVLDIGGQDTKAIQIDESGVVTNFQMNDRCAAGCGRYLGYIADELNVGLHELGPLSMRSERACRICSTCTVFAGAELRDLLSLGERRENILAGLHQAIVLRAMSLLARSGGVENEFTFTGGVAKNEAVVQALRDLVCENYGDKKLNIHTDSIYTGALGAALYAHRAIDLEDANVA